MGGKNSSLGELYSSFPEGSVKVPNGFAVTADAYRDGMTKAGMWGAFHTALDDLDKRNINELAERTAKARDIVYGMVLIVIA